MFDNNKRIPMIPPTIAELTVSILAETVDYNHRIMNIPAMWKRTKGDNVKLVVLDSGIPKHVDLMPSGGKSFIFGYSEDENGHATHCAGIIAAIANNDMGVRGIAPFVEDYYGTVLDKDGTGTINDIILGIYWAVDDIKADIISMSLGIAAEAEDIPELKQACQYAYDHNVTIFAAAGNEYGAVGQPARYDCVYAVAAIDKNLSHADFSNRGKEVDFACGGVKVFSTYLRNTYAKLSGTSMATPALAAAAALIVSDIKSDDPDKVITPADLGLKLRKICFDIGAKGFDEETGFGIPMFINYAADKPQPRPDPDIEPEPEPEHGKVKGLGSMPAADCLYWRVLSKSVAEINARLDKGHTVEDAVAAGLRKLGHNVDLINHSIRLKENRNSVESIIDKGSKIRP